MCTLPKVGGFVCPCVWWNAREANGVCANGERWWQIPRAELGSGCRSKHGRDTFMYTHKGARCAVDRRGAACRLRSLPHVPSCAGRAPPLLLHAHAGARAALRQWRCACSRAWCVCACSNVLYVCVCVCVHSAENAIRAHADNTEATVMGYADLFARYCTKPLFALLFGRAVAEGMRACCASAVPSPPITGAFWCANSTREAILRQPVWADGACVPLRTALALEAAAAPPP